MKTIAFKSILLVFTLSLASPVVAQVNTVTNQGSGQESSSSQKPSMRPPASEIFKDANSLDKSLQPPQFSNVVPATFNFLGGMNCTATFVSPDGYFISAAHCVELCLARAGVLSQVFAPGIDISNYEEVAVSVNEDSLKKGLYCSAFRASNLPPQVRNSHNEFVPKGYRLRVVALGAPKFLVAETLDQLITNNPSGVANAQDAGFTGMGAEGDFAIFKLESDDSSTASEYPCVHVAKDSPKLNDPVWTVAYPVFKRTDGSSANLDRLLYSSGRITNGVEEIELTRNASDDQKKEFQMLYQRPGTFFSSVDAESGSSGSAIYNSSGEIAGITYAVQKRDGDYDYEFGSTQSISISQIRNRLNQFLGSNQVDQIFSCK